MSMACVFHFLVEIQKDNQTRKMRQRAIYLEEGCRVCELNDV